MPKPASEIRVGMLADDVLKMRGRSVGYAVAAPEWIVQGRSVRWHYADCSVVLERDGEDGPYRVKEIEEREEENGTEG